MNILNRPAEPDAGEPSLPAGTDSDADTPVPAGTDSDADASVPAGTAREEDTPLSPDASENGAGEDMAETSGNNP